MSASTRSPMRRRRRRRAPREQYDLLNLLVAELKEIGVQDARLTDYGAVLATIPATIATDTPTIALLAHVDTTPQYSGTGVKPIVHRNYQGTDIVLPDDPQMVLSPAALPYLAAKVGDDIVTASGTTLLGADDKAGVAIIMVAARHLMSHRDIPHGPLRICFTPDEEIGRGVHPDLPGDLNAAFAYTLDGAAVGRDRLRDLLGRRGGGHHPGRLDPSRLGQGQAGERAAPRGQDRRHAAPGHAARPKPPTAARASSTSTR